MLRLATRCFGRDLRRRRGVFLLLLLVFVYAAGDAAEGAVICVVQTGAGDKNGNGWENALGEEEFITALTNASPGTDFWVAAGTYRPTTGTNRSESFVLKKGVALYGGFAGTESARDQRAPAKNTTILSGNIGDAEETSDNSYHVVKAGAGMDDTAILDGFTITGGRANGNGDNRQGGGMFIKSASPEVTACTFSENTADSVGGGMYISVGSPKVTACTFSKNTAYYGGGMAISGGSPEVTACTFSKNTADTTGGGGGMYTISSNPKVTGCTFESNSAYYGGGIYNANSPSKVTNCTFAGNSASPGGGGIYNTALNGDSSKFTIASNCTFVGNTAGTGRSLYNDKNRTLLINCIFWGSGSNAKQLYDDDAGTSSFHTYNCITDLTGEHHHDPVNDNPRLGPLKWNGGPTRTFSLATDSPAYNMGRDVGVTGYIYVVSEDQRGVSRPQGGKVDIGAYEYRADKKVLVVETEGGGVQRIPGGDAFGASGTQWTYDTDCSVTLTANPEAPWYFVDWGQDAVSAGTDPNATVTMSEDKHVAARFAKGWVIVASADAGGSVAPSGAVVVVPGEDQTFGITPHADFSVADVTVDGVSVGAATTYTFTNVTGDHTIAAAFTANATPTPTPTPTPTSTPTPTPTTEPQPTPTDLPVPTEEPTPPPHPTPNANIRIPPVTLTITLMSGGRILAGPLEINNSTERNGVLASEALWEQLLALNQEAVLAGDYGMEVARFFSLFAELGQGEAELTLLLEATVGDADSGYVVEVFLLVRTFDENGNPAGYVLLPREEGAPSTIRRNAASKAWTAHIADGGECDGVSARNAALSCIAAVPAVVPVSAPGNIAGGGGCDALGSAGAVFSLLFLAPLFFLMKR